MKFCQRILSAAALLSLASVQSACITMPNMIQISSNDWSRNPPDLARLARCSEFEVAIADSSSTVLYGEPNAGMVWGYVIHDTEIDQEAMRRIRDHVGQTFADHLQRAFPGKKVSYNSRVPDSSVNQHRSAVQDQDSRAVCLLSYTYIILSEARFSGFQPIWGKFHRTLPGEVAVIEQSPPLFLPKEQAYVPGVGWTTDRAFWAAGTGTAASQESTSHAQYPLGPITEVKVLAPGVSRPKSVRLDYEKLERSMLEWANERAGGLARQLGDALRSKGYGG